MPLCPPPPGTVITMPGVTPSQKPQTQQQQKLALPNKVIEAALSGLANNPAFDVFEDVKSVQPNDSWYDPVRNPNNPTQIEVSHYEVPRGRGLVIFEFDLQPFQFSGVGAFESVPIGRQFLNGIMGYSFQINGKVPGVVKFELEPTPANFERRMFRPDPTNLVDSSRKMPSDFARNNATSYGKASGFGTGIMPQRNDRFGPLFSPVAFIALEQQHITIHAIVYRPVSRPLSFVRADLRGYISSAVNVQKFVDDMKAAQ